MRRNVRTDGRSMPKTSLPFLFFNHGRPRSTAQCVPIAERPIHFKFLTHRDHSKEDTAAKMPEISGGQHLVTAPLYRCTNLCFLFVGWTKHGVALVDQEVVDVNIHAGYGSVAEAERQRLLLSSNKTIAKLETHAEQCGPEPGYCSSRQ